MEFEKKPFDDHGFSILIEFTGPTFSLMFKLMYLANFITEFDENFTELKI
jgi:hypothetical protein